MVQTSVNKNLERMLTAVTSIVTRSGTHIDSDRKAAYDTAHHRKNKSNRFSSKEVKIYMIIVKTMSCPRMTTFFPQKLRIPRYSI